MSRARWALVLGMLGMAAFGAWLAWLSVYRVDDAWIVYRYAANLARGRGFVYNPGERVEGVTCFLWTLVLAPFAAAGLPLPATAPILTALAGSAVVLLLPGVSARLSGRSAPDSWDRGAAALLAAHPGFAYWSVGALETIPYSLILVLALRARAGEMAGGKGRRSAVWMGLATLMRPEAPLLAAVLAPAGGDTRQDAPRSRVREICLWSAVVAAFFLPFLLFRRLYFGDWLPNTYYAKTGEGLLHNLHDGRLYLSSFLSSLVPGFGHHDPLTGLAGAAIVLAVLAWALPRRGLRPAALLVCALGAAVLLEGGDWMVLFRFLVPALPPLILLMTAAGRSLSRESPRLKPWLALLGGLLFCSFLWAGVVERGKPDGLLVNAAGYRHAHRAVADFLKTRALPMDVVALMDIGLIGYETDLPIIDISGLTDRAIARAPGGFLHKKYPVEALLDRAPRFFILVDGFPIDDAIAGDAGFQRRYVRVFERNHRFNWTPPGSYWLRVFERREDTEATGQAPAPGIR